MQARHGGAAVAALRAKNEKGIHLPGEPFRVIDRRDIDKLSSNGPAVAVEGRVSSFRVHGRLKKKRYASGSRNTAPSCPIIAAVSFRFRFALMIVLRRMRLTTFPRSTSATSR